MDVINQLLHHKLATYTKKQIGFSSRGVIQFQGEDRHYYFNYDKPLTNILQKKNSNPKYKEQIKSMAPKLVKNTLSNAYKTGTAINKIKKIYDEVRTRRVKKVLSGHSLKYKPDINETQSALKSYTNSIIIKGIKLKGLNGLSYIKYQHLNIKEYLKKLNGLKLLVDVKCTTLKDPDDDSTVDTFHTRSRVHVVLTAEELQNALQTCIDDITLDIENKALKGSGFTIQCIEDITIYINRYNPTRGASYIALPEWIANKKACINIKNNDKKCFKCSVQCGVYDVSKKVILKEYHVTKK